MTGKGVTAAIQCNVGRYSRLEHNRIFSLNFRAEENRVAVFTVLNRGGEFVGGHDDINALGCVIGFNGGYDFVVRVIHRQRLTIFQLPRLTAKLSEIVRRRGEVRERTGVKLVGTDRPNVGNEIGRYHFSGGQFRLDFRRSVQSREGLGIRIGGNRQCTVSTGNFKPFGDHVGVNAGAVVVVEGVVVEINRAGDGVWGVCSLCSHTTLNEINIQNVVVLNFQVIEIDRAAVVIFIPELDGRDGILGNRSGEFTRSRTAETDTGAVGDDSIVLNRDVAVHVKADTRSGRNVIAKDTIGNDGIAADDYITRALNPDGIQAVVEVGFRNREFARSDDTVAGTGFIIIRVNDTVVNRQTSGTLMNCGVVVRGILITLNRKILNRQVLASRVNVTGKLVTAAVQSNVVRYRRLELNRIRGLNIRAKDNRVAGFTVFNRGGELRFIHDDQSGHILGGGDSADNSLGVSRSIIFNRVNRQLLILFQGNLRTIPRGKVFVIAVLGCFGGCRPS